MTPPQELGISQECGGNYLWDCIPAIPLPPQAKYFTYSFESDLYPGAIVSIPWRGKMIYGLALKKSSESIQNTKKGIYTQSAIDPRWITIALEFNDISPAMLAYRYIPFLYFVKNKKIETPIIFADTATELDFGSSYEDTCNALVDLVAQGEKLVVFCDTEEAEKFIIEQLFLRGCVAIRSTSPRKWTKKNSELWERSISTPGIIVTGRRGFFIPWSNTQKRIVLFPESQWFRVERAHPYISATEVCALWKKVSYPVIAIYGPAPKILATKITQLYPKGDLVESLNNVIEEKMNQKSHGIIIYNRRGSERVWECADCGWIARCEISGCLKPLYTIENGNWVCGTHGVLTKGPSQICPLCSSLKINARSYGCSHLAKELKERYFQTDEHVSISTNIQNYKLTAERNILVTTRVPLWNFPPLQWVAYVGVDADLALPSRYRESDFRSYIYFLVWRFPDVKITLWCKNPNLAKILQIT